MAYAQVLEALSEPRRREILQALRAAPLSVGEIAQTQTISRPAVSQHLKVLMSAHLVWAEQKGTRRIYHVERTGLDALRRWLDGFWDDTITVLEDGPPKQAPSER